MAGVGSRSSYRSLRVFKKLAILSVPCQYRFSLMFVVDNLKNFQTNSSIHGVDTRNKTQLHRPITNLSYFQKSFFYARLGIFNSLPSNIVLYCISSYKSLQNDIGHVQRVVTVNSIRITVKANKHVNLI
jgi:hypothetical protein